MYLLQIFKVLFILLLNKYDCLNYYYVLEFDGQNTQMDFLNCVSIPTGVSMIITNPPWSQNKKFLTKAFELGIVFAFLLKSEIQGTKYFRQLILKYKACAIPNAPKVTFLNPLTNKSIQVGSTFWLIGNFRPEFLSAIPLNCFALMYYAETPPSSQNDIIEEQQEEIEDEDAELARLEFEEYKRLEEEFEGKLI